jgi:hypothetical protein
MSIFRKPVEQPSEAKPQTGVCIRCPRCGEEFPVEISPVEQQENDDYDALWQTSRDIPPEGGFARLWHYVGRFAQVIQNCGG